MPLIVPPSLAYQGPLIAAPGVWNKAPPEGDRMIPVEFDWGANTVTAYRLELSAGNAVPLSQIAALAVDNSQCGVDVNFLFPDTGFNLRVPAFGNGVFPVITNALSFYAIGTGAAGRDQTVVNICNSNPPPQTIQPSSEQSLAAQVGVSLTAVASTSLIAATVNGVLEAVNVVAAFTTGGVAQNATLKLIDGMGNTVWAGALAAPATSTSTIPLTLSGIRARFFNGLSFRVDATTIGTGNATVSVYYGKPA